MPVVKQSDGRWLIDVRPNGSRGKRIRKRFDSKAEALRFEAHARSEAAHKPWNPKKRDLRKLSELLQIWKNNHGQYLKDCTRRYSVLTTVCAALGDPVAETITAQDFVKYRNSKAGVNGKPINPKTLNNHLGYCNAVFNELHRMDVISYPNPFAKVRLIKIAERELAYLTADQIGQLLKAIKGFSKNPHVLLLSKICLSTGCRWGEAESLTADRVKNDTVTFTDTKSGKNRTVPITKQLANEILAHGRGKLFSSSMKAFDRALGKSGIETLPGQSTHILRHTFASHFIMNGGDLLTLQKILGHSTIMMTMRYSHLSEDHLAKARDLNPMIGLKLDS